MTTATRRGFLTTSPGSIIWDRRGGVSTISRKLYMFLICIFTAIGVAVSAGFSRISQGWQLDNWNGWAVAGFFIGVLLVGALGTLMADVSNKPPVSALGYLLVAGPFGLMLGPVVALYETSSVFKALAITSGVVIILGVVGVLIPDDLSSWGVPLLGGLLLVLGGLFVVPILGTFGFPVEAGMTVVDWIGLLVFGGLIVYDLNKASRLPYTVDNAIDCSLAVYLDYVNVFLFLLRLVGVKKS